MVVVAPTPVVVPLTLSEPPRLPLLLLLFVAVIEFLSDITLLPLPPFTPLLAEIEEEEEEVKEEDDMTRADDTIDEGSFPGILTELEILEFVVMFMLFVFKEL